MHASHCTMNFSLRHGTTQSLDHVGDSIHALLPNGGQRRNAWLMVGRNHHIEDCLDSTPVQEEEECGWKLCRCYSQLAIGEQLEGSASRSGKHFLLKQLRVRNPEVIHAQSSKQGTVNYKYGPDSTKVLSLKPTAHKTKHKHEAVSSTIQQAAW